MAIGNANQIIVVRAYEDDGEEVLTTVLVEASDPDVDLTIHPFKSDAVTYSLSVEDAWKLARELARMASAIENRGEDE